MIDYSKEFTIDLKNGDKVLYNPKDGKLPGLSFHMRCKDDLGNVFYMRLPRVIDYNPALASFNADVIYELLDKIDELQSKLNPASPSNE